MLKNIYIKKTNLHDPRLGLKILSTPYVFGAGKNSKLNDVVSNISPNSHAGLNM